MLKKLLLTLAIVLVLFGAMAAFVATRPAEFRIARTISIAASPETIFPSFNDFRKTAAWSPWEKVDPGMNRSYEGPSSGVGSIYSWDGNDQVGAGKMTILESHPYDLVKCQLENIRPFQSTSEIAFALTPNAKGTTVEWSLTGHRNFIEKLFCTFMNTDKVIGPEFEKGLAQLKDVIETDPKTGAATRSVLKTASDAKTASDLKTVSSAKTSTILKSASDSKTASAAKTSTVPKSASDSKTEPASSTDLAPAAD